MLAGIQCARSTITFESYIYWAGAIGEAFAQALAERSRAGVQVHVLLDWMGSAKIDRAIVQTLLDAGVQVHRYHPVRWYTLGKLNNRTHRKLLVIDGTLGFTGGVGIAPEWTGHAQDPDHWRDTHFRIVGPVVGQLQSVFLDNWIKVAGDVPHGIGFFPPLPDAGTMSAQVFSSSPSGGSDSMQLMYLLAITATSQSIDLSAAYFVPDPLSSKALLAALQRGVRVRIVVPGPHIDSDAARSASRAAWGPLLAAGAIVAEYQPTMYHCKVMIIDAMFTSLTSTTGRFI